MANEAHVGVATVLQDRFGLHVNRSTVCRAVTRVARRSEATWHACLLWDGLPPMISQPLLAHL